MDAVVARSDTRAPVQQVTWLSGGIVTFINKIGSILWLDRVPFGQVVYYIPKWAAIKCFWVAPEKELQELLDSNPRL